MKKTPLKRSKGLKRQPMRRKKAKKKRRKGQSRKTLANDCNTLWSMIVRARDGCCQVCGKKINLNAHHLIRRSKNLYHYDLNNGMCLCSYHHQFSRDCSPHAGGMGFAEWLMDKRPEVWQWWQAAKYAVNTTITKAPTMAELRTLKVALQAKLESVQQIREATT